MKPGRGRKQHSGVTEQRKASLQRLKDAKVLLAGSRWRGAMYMAGYAVECLLKFQLMRQLSCRNLVQLERQLQQRGEEPRVFSHDLENLLRLAGGRERLRKSPLWKSFSAHVNAWQPNWRYDPLEGEQEEAELFVKAVQALLPWIENNL
jgi:HEPN domain-containing protein